MASDDIPQISAVAIQDDTTSGPTLPFPSPNISSHPLFPRNSSLDIYGAMTAVLRNSPHFPDNPITSASYASDASSLPPPSSPTLSAHSSGLIRRVNSTLLRDNSPEEQHGLSSLVLLAPPSQAHRQKSSTATYSSIGSNTTDHDAVPSGRSDAVNTLPSPTNTHIDAVPDTSHPSTPAAFFKRTAQRVRHPSPYPSDNFEMGSDITRDCTDVNRERAKLAHPAVLDLKQEADLNVEPFSFMPLQLASLVDSKSLEGLEGLGGVSVLLHGLGVHRHRGLSSQIRSRAPTTINAVAPFGTEMTSDGLQSTASLGGGSSGGRPASFKFPAGAYEATIEDRQRIYGQYILPQRPSKSLLRLMWLVLWGKLWGKVIVLLSVAAIVSFALGLFQDFGTTRPRGEPPLGWVEGVAIVAAVLVVVVVVGSLNSWQKERQFKVLNAKKEYHLVKVIRDGEERYIHGDQVVVGDVMILERGDVIPCDGIFLSGHNVRCDESSATGESGSIKKVSYEECVALRDKRPTELDPGGPSGDGELLGRADCFIVSGSKVLEGAGSHVVVAVGTKSFNGRIMKASSDESENENTPLRLKLNDLADAIIKIGTIAGGLLFASLLVRYFFELGTTVPQRTSGKGLDLVNILMISVTLVVVAVPEGLPLAITLALAFATKQMSKENILVRAVRSCETMANASTIICTDKTGTLTRNEITIVAGTVGVHAKFVRSLEERTGVPNPKDFSVDLANLDAVLPRPLKNLFNEAIANNSTAFGDVDPESGAPVIIGSKIESALLGFAKELGWPNCKDTRGSVDIVQMIPFSSERKFMGCVVRLPNGSHRLYVKGAGEILAPNCTRHVVLGDSGANEIETAPIGVVEQRIISTTITSYASQTLRTIALCYRDFPSWPPKRTQLLGRDEVDYGSLMTDLTLISVIAIEDLLHPGVREDVANCGKAGVRVKLCTGDNVLAAKTIARQCGIYTPGGVVMQGPHFRTLPPDMMKAIVPQLQVLARSSPEDKRILVETLKDLGDIVGVTGGGTNDIPALESAHVGFSMGISGTEVAKEASDIILMDDDFHSIVKAIMWGRCVKDSVRKFLQFQISAKVTAVVITFIWALASSSEESPLSAAQLLWANLIMDAFAALALATDQASSAQLERKPDKKTDPLFSINMIKQILGQAIYQITVILIFHFLGLHILGFHHTNTDDATLRKHHHDIVRTLIFNSFVFAQIFNSFNCRRLNRKLNVFEGLTRNWYFMAITAIEVVVQLLICFYGGSAFDVTHIGAREWGISLALGFLSLPLGAFIRLIPNEPCERAFTKLQLLPTLELLPTIRPDAEPGSLFATDHVRDNTFPLRHRCGDGSIYGKSHIRHRHAFSHVDGTHHLTLTPNASRTAAPDWPWRARGPRSDPCFDSSTSSSTLGENVFEIHPDTPPDDPVYELLGTAPPSATPAACAP